MTEENKRYYVPYGYISETRIFDNDIEVYLSNTKEEREKEDLKIEIKRLETIIKRDKLWEEMALNDIQSCSNMKWKYWRNYLDLKDNIKVSIKKLKDTLDPFLYEDEESLKIIEEMENIIKEAEENAHR